MGIGVSSEKLEVCQVDVGVKVILGSGPSHTLSDWPALAWKPSRTEGGLICVEAGVWIGVWIGVSLGLWVY